MLTVSSLLGGCCHLGGDDDAEGFDPCEDKQEGETCQLCPPDDPDCVETQEVKVCDAEGTCGGTEASTHAH